VTCARAAVYQGLGVDGDPYSEETLRRFGRGTRIGRAMAEEIAATLATQGRRAIVEVDAPWPKDNPVGVGHADLHIPDESTVVEVVSTAGCALPPHKALQVVGYADSLDCEQARVVSVDPHTGDDRTYPINVEAILPLAREVQRRVVEGLNGGPLPARLNGEEAHPGGYPCSDCPFRRSCYADWTPPPAGRLPGYADDIGRLAVIELAMKKAGREERELKVQRDEIRATLAAVMADGQDYIEQGVRVRRTPVAGRRTLAFSAMEAAGFALPPEVEEFVSTGDGYDKWTVSEVKT
jgi:hypothetical protein